MVNERDILSVKNIKYSPKIINACFVLLLVSQCICMYAFGVQKTGYHVDEMFTFTLTNYPGGFIAGDAVGRWTDGEVLADALTVSQENAFNYDMVYHNQEGDVHPPLYYYVIHTISSLFLGQFSKWMGIFPNMIFCIITSVFLFSSAKRLFKDEAWALMATAAWALSIGAMDSAVFLRMYAMLTMLAVILFRCHLKALEELTINGAIKKITFFMLFFCTVLGILTQYYYLIFCFFICGVFAIGLLFGKNWKNLIGYVTAEFAAIGVAILYYPAMLRHMFSDYRGKEAIENLANGDNYSEVLKNVFQVITNDLFNGMMFFGLLGVCIIGRLIYSYRLKSANNEMKGFVSLSKEALVVSLLTIAILGYILVVSKISPYQTDRYYMCIYPFVSLIAVWILQKICSCYKKEEIALGFGAVCVALLIILSYNQQTSSHLYLEFEERAVLDEYKSYPMVILNEATYDSAPIRWLTEFDNYSKVYWGVENSDFSSLADAAETLDISDGFLLYVQNACEGDEELLAHIREYIPVKNYMFLTGGECHVYFCTLEVES